MSALSDKNVKNFVEFADLNNVVKISASNPTDKQSKVKRVVLTKISGNNKTFFQAEKFVEKQVFHDNLSFDQVGGFFDENILGQYRQICFVCCDFTATYLMSAKGKVTRLVNNDASSAKQVTSQNRQKNYILAEGVNIPVLVDLGIFTKDFKVVNSMFDKYKQINRFVEILDDRLKNEKELTVLDFGCGKSYLTFVVYYYLTQIRHIKANVIGYDVKSDVVANCNKLAQKYGCDNLHFVVADVSKDKLYDQNIDVVISLHACDTATDFALAYAVEHKAKYIFSVPCCQHELNLQKFKQGGDLDILLNYGIVKERVCALLTDAFRAKILEDMGYSVDVMEFVDLAHSPKNLMLRATLCGKPSQKNKAELDKLRTRYGFEQCLYNLVYSKS